MSPWWQQSVSIRPRTGPPKLARSRRHEPGLADTQAAEVAKMPPTESLGLVINSKRCRYDYVVVREVKPCAVR